MPSRKETAFSFASCKLTKKWPSQTANMIVDFTICSSCADFINLCPLSDWHPCYWYHLVLEHQRAKAAGGSDWALMCNNFCLSKIILALGAAFFHPVTCSLIKWSCPDNIWTAMQWHKHFPTVKAQLTVVILQGSVREEPAWDGRNFVGSNYVPKQIETLKRIWTFQWFQSQIHSFAVFPAWWRMNPSVKYIWHI